MALFWRIWTAVVLVNLVVLTLFVGLATLQFNSINSGLVGERLSVLAGRTAAPFRSAARIGLSLETVRNAAALLERARQTDDAIEAIHVFDATGHIVHSTDLSAPAAIPAEALQVWRRSGAAPWHSETEAGFFSGIDIASNRGASAGGILIVYPGGGNVTRIRAMAAELALMAIIVFLGASTLAIAVLRLGLRRQIHAFEAVDSAISGYERDAWRRAADPDHLVGGSDLRTGDQDHELRGLLDHAETRYRNAGKALSSAKGDGG